MFAKEVFDRRAIWPTARRNHRVLGRGSRLLSMVFQVSDSQFQPDASDWMSRDVVSRLAARDRQNAVIGTRYALSSEAARKAGDVGARFLVLVSTQCSWHGARAVPLRKKGMGRSRRSSEFDRETFVKVRSNMVQKHTSAADRRSQVPAQLNPCKASVFAEALGRLGGDEELLRELAAILVDDVPPLVQGVQSAIQAGDFGEAHRDAHALKGLVVTFDERGCGLMISELMTALKENNSQEIHRLSHSCIEAVENLRLNCKRLLD